MSEAAQKQDGLPIGGVPADKILLVWPKVEPLLKRVVKPNTGYALPHVLTELQLGRMQLWVIGDFQAVVVTMIQDRPLHKVLWTQFIAGENMDEWLSDWVAVQEDYARSMGCVAVEFCGRKGWGKVQKHHPQFKHVWTIYRCELWAEAAEPIQ